MSRKFTSILTEDIDEGILAKMPEWFRRLREAYKEKIYLPRCTDLGERERAAAEPF